MTTKPALESESTSTSSIFLPQLRHPQRGSLASVSAASQLDKETLSEALDQIHNSACQTETLTTFNEYTSPPSSSSGTDGKGIASELQGGLSGLYNRFRASVGNVRDIVNLNSEDGSLNDKSHKGQHRETSSPAAANIKIADSEGFPTSSVVSLAPSQIPDAGRHQIPDKDLIDRGVSDSDQQIRSAKILIGGSGLPLPISLPAIPVSHSSIASLTQVTTGVVARPAVAEINVSAVKDREPGGKALSNGSSSNSVMSSRPLLGSRAEARLSGNIEKQKSDPIGGSKADDSNINFHVQQAGRSTLDSLTTNPSRFGDVKVCQEARGGRKSGSVGEDDYFPRDAQFDGSDMVNQSTNDRLGSSSNIVYDAPKIVTNLAAPQDKLSTDVDDRENLMDDINPQFPSESTYQNLEIPTRRSLAPIQVKSLRSSDSNQSQISSSDALGNIPRKNVRQNLTNHEQTAEVDVHRGTIGLEPIIPATAQHDTDSRTMNVFSQVKSKILNKEYWMRDENARDCFYCGDPFSTFRRKHHCRTCGQIFDAKCTSLLSGTHFGQPGSLRVCKPCEGIINGYDDSSEFSDDSNIPISGLRPRHGSAGASDTLASPGSRSTTPINEDLRQSPKHPDLSIPTMAIPATRWAGGESSKKSILEIDGERTLLRPSSSRSLKSSATSRPYSTIHRRFNSRHLNQRGYKPLSEESAPFHRNPADDRGKQSRLRAFHDDNIIDPDLAPFLSDEGSSGDEQLSIMTAINSEGTRSYDNERHGFTGLLSSSKKGRSRIGDKSISGATFASRDTDNISLSSLKSLNLPRGSKRRNLNSSGNLHLRPSPRIHRASTVLPALGLALHESSNNSGLSQMLPSNPPIGGSRLIRSSSMRGAAAPVVELNSASLQHVRRLLRQLLQDSQVPFVASWEKALIPILLQATDDVNPDILNGDDIDIRHYVKLKKIPGGHPGDTAYVSGLVFTKNLALKSMPRNIAHPRILILTFALEYARHQQHFMSLEPVIRQEREFLQNLVNRIIALRPQLLLVERNVSGLALEFLEQAKIATAYNVKASVLEAVSRCTQTRIISSIDKLAIKPAQIGKCENFYLKTYVHGERKKTYTFLSGCPKELGCTIVLRGAKNETLAKIKKITEFMVYVVYNLKLETCLMRDEFALIPSTNGDPSIPCSIETLNPSSLSSEGVIKRDSTIAGNSTHFSGTKDPTEAPLLDLPKPLTSSIPEALHHITIMPDDASMPEDVPMPKFYGEIVEQHETKILSASPFVKFAPPYLLVRAREQERRLAYLKRLRDQDVLEEINEDEMSKPQKFDLIKPEMIHEKVRGASKKVREVIHAVHDAEYDNALHKYKMHTKQWESYIAGNINIFDPYEHQNIAVLYSVVCTVTTVPCSGPDLLALSFYNEHEIDEEFEADCTLGQYVEDLTLGANTVCTANGCERKMLDHHRQYVHGEAQVSVFVERYPCKLRGLQNTILMWSCCRICGKETQVMPMSESSWKYSFGKYLELSFWSTKLRARADVCPHDLHRDHLRYFGFQDIALRLHYDRINLLEIVVPRAKITWKVHNDLRFKNDLFEKIEERLNKYMASVKNRLKSIKVESVIPEKSEICKQQVDELLMRAYDDHKSLIQRLQDLYMDSKHYEIIPLNQAIRTAQEKVAEWDKVFTDFDRNFFPSEKDIRRLTALQLKKIFLDRDESTTSLNSTDESSVSSIPEEMVTEKEPLDGSRSLIPQTRTISPEKAHDMLTSIVKQHSNDTESLEVGKLDRNPSTHVVTRPSARSDHNHKSHQIIESENIQHLDLAVPSNAPDMCGSSETNILPNYVPNTLVAQSGSNSGKPQSDEKTQEPIGAPSHCTEKDETVELLPKNPNQPDPISGIPSAFEVGNHPGGSSIPPPLYRAKSQPAHIVGEKARQNQASATLPEFLEIHSHLTKPGETITKSIPAVGKPAEKKLSDRLGLGALKNTGVSAHSMIPRSITSRRKDTNVSNLAKHFEQLSREFEKERIRDRRQRAAKSRQVRAYPMAASRPIVEIYRNVHEAVEEKDPSDEDLLSSEPPPEDHDETPSTINQMADTKDSHTSGQDSHVDDTTAETTETEEANNVESQLGSDAEGEGNRSEEERSMLGDIEVPGTAEEHHALSPSEAQLNMKLDLPKHEKTSLMKMLTNFWAERSASGWQPLEYPLNATDHIFADSDIIVREDEPSSLISFALASEDYQSKLQAISETFGNRYSRKEKTQAQDSTLDPDDQLVVERSLLRSTGTHLKYQFQEGSAKMLCKVFFAEQFDAVRRKCGVDGRIIESLSRCLKWDSKGGKTKSVFLKTLDDRLVLKSLSPIETQAFLRFAPAYFRIISEALFHELPSVIAKMLGFYQIIIKNPATGVEFNWFLLVMENLFYDRSPTRIFDLKGSMRNRRIQSTGERDEVLLDENMVEFIYESPLFSREHSKRILRSSVWNDTLFLARQNVMDYSLMIAIDENRKELVIGIIDCIRTYTWDKKLETWIKDRGKNRPTVTSPREYKNRFREAMGRYVLQAPNCWHQFKAQQVETRTLKLPDDRDDIKEGEGDGELLRVA